MITICAMQNIKEQKTKVVAGDNNEKQPDKPKEEKKEAFSGFAEKRSR